MKMWAGILQEMKTQEEIKSDQQEVKDEIKALHNIVRTEMGRFQEEKRTKAQRIFKLYGGREQRSRLIHMQLNEW